MMVREPARPVACPSGTRVACPSGTRPHPEALTVTDTAARTADFYRRRFPEADVSDLPCDGLRVTWPDGVRVVILPDRAVRVAAAGPPPPAGPPGVPSRRP